MTPEGKPNGASAPKEAAPSITLEQCKEAMARFKRKGTNRKQDFWNVWSNLDRLFDLAHNNLCMVDPEDEEDVFMCLYGTGQAHLGFMPSRPYRAPAQAHGADESGDVAAEADLTLQEPSSAAGGAAAAAGAAGAAAA
eukprot:CAMPEP_0202895416 /NCGR_PEP_ID=MMETSP1392-20130828/4629_1 /ASSEMBLY_ACC=CAM_ASM_000868 /TAXON_ID=225041 /ORGANISM="Chlamydomonas chlamydogama, Strain SAG 11-48b" /LENGTH=137 /DNA_ID=CAMNT_0049580425 /DNA_START=5 /DNA_END=414 /DNA_ORIENTATION=+